MYHPKMNVFDRTMKELFDEVDDYCEDRWGDRYDLHPNRPRRGATAHKASDGLFNIGSQFTAGYGSEYGRGYIIDMKLSTLEAVPSGEREHFLQAVAQKVRELLPVYFPGRQLEVVRDGAIFKITGDLSLGDV